MQSSSTKQVDARRSTVLSRPFQLVFPAVTHRLANISHRQTVDVCGSGDSVGSLAKYFKSGTSCRRGRKSTFNFLVLTSSDQLL